MDDNFQKGNDYDYVGFWARVGASILDSLILIPLLFVFYKGYTYATENQVIWPVIVIFCTSLSYQLYFIVKHGGTPGKLITNMRIIDEHGSYLSIQKAIIRLIPSILTSLLNSVAVFVISLEVATIISLLKGLVSLFTFVDVLFVAFTANKRAIHDYMAGSYVVTKDSLFNQDDKTLES
ncbi:RDD family protein [Wukongibacter baidiensis]|uniref:RDD family protein n=1 Tax=Wukongibacter baidiensis TaxID=1723361 RepID=UPI003D7F2B1D